MTTNKFDPAPILEVLPSFWREYYKDKDVLSTVYEALLRIQEVDYNRLFTLDDTKQLSTVPVLTRYPVVYDLLSNWESTGSKHAHTKVTVNFNPEYATYFDESTQYCRVRFPGYLFKYDCQIYLDGRAIPAQLYTKSFDPYYEDGNYVYGTTIYFNVDRVAAFLSIPEEFQDYGQVADEVTDSDDYGLIEGDVAVSSDLGGLGWKDLAAVQYATAYAYKVAIPLTTDTDGELSEFDLDMSDTINTDDSVVYLESVDITSKTTIVYGTDAVEITPTVPLENSQLIKVVWENGASRVFEISDSVSTITHWDTSDIVAVKLMIDFQLYPSIVELETTQLTLSGKNRFYAGSVVRVVDNAGTQSFKIPASTNKIVFDRSIDLNTVKVMFHGIDLLAVEIGESAIRLTSRAPKNLTLKVDAVLYNDHEHAIQSVTVATNTTQITLDSSVTLGNQEGDESEWFPTRVFLDGTLQLAGIHYEFYTDSEIRFFDTVSAGSVVTVLSDISGDLQHTHTYEYISRDTVATDKIPLTQEVIADAPFELYINASLGEDTGEIDLVNGQVLSLTGNTPDRAVLVFRGIKASWLYRHELLDRVDTRYGYRGRVSDVAYIQDGIVTSSVLLSKESGDISVVETDNIVWLYSNTKIEDAWLFDVDVDERLLSKKWGTLFDINEPSTEDLAVRISALLAAARAPAFVDNIENFGSIVLGSKFLEQGGVSLGVVDALNGSKALVVQPADPTATTFEVPLIDGASVRVREGELLPEWFAVNSLLQVFDRDLTSIPWLAFMAEELSNDFRFAKRLDAKRSFKLTGTPTAFDPNTGIVTDATEDFIEAEIRIKDLALLEFTDTGEPTTDLTAPIVTSVVEVINGNQFKVAPFEASGFGEDVFGTGPFGGSQHTAQLKRYTIWTRAVRKLDQQFQLDIAPSNENSLVSGESVAEVNSQLAELLRHHIFVLKIDWQQMTSEESLASLDKMINLIKPAKTKALVYTQFENDSGITESLGVQFGDETTTLSVSGDRVADAFHSGTSHIGSVYSAQTAGKDPLYNPFGYVVGPTAFALTSEPDPVHKNQQYYLTSSRTDMLLAGSAWASVYSDIHGLESLVLKSETDGALNYYYVPSPSRARQPGKAIHLDGTRRLRVNDWTHDGNDFTVRTWLNIAFDLDASSSPILMSFEGTGCRIGVDYISATSYNLAVYTSPSAKADMFEVSPDTDLFMALCYRAADLEVDYFIAGGRHTGTWGTVSTEAINAFDGELIIGAGEGVLVADSYPLNVTLDETVIVNYAADEEQCQDWYTNATWSGPMGVRHSGSPMAEDGALLVFHYDREDAELGVVYDYSGQGLNAIRESDDVDDLTTDWFIDGVVNTPLPAEKDYYELSRDGYYVSAGSVVTIPVFNEEVGRRDTQDVLVRQGNKYYYAPNVSFYYNGSGWVRVEAFPSSIGSSIDVNNLNGEFTGFTDGEFIDPNNILRTSIISGDYEIGDSPVVTVSAKNNGAISSIIVDGQEILSVNSKADALAQRWEIGTNLVLAEAGNDSQSPQEQSVARLISYEFSGQIATIKSYVPYSTPYGGEFECSSHILDKRVQGNFLNNSCITAIESQLTTAPTLNSTYVGWVYQAALDEDLTEVHTFRVGTDGPTFDQPIYQGVVDAVDHQISTSYKGGLILSSFDGSKAFGIYHHGPSRSNYYIVSDVEYLQGPNRVLLSSTEYVTNSGGVTSQSKTRYVCAGNFAQVVSAFAELYAHFEGISAPTYTFPAVKLQAAITSPLNVNIELDDTVTIGVVAKSAFGTIDSNYNEDIVATITDINTGDVSYETATAVNGVGSFDNLAFTEYGSKSLLFSSGTLTPDGLSIDIYWPVPRIISLTPSTAVAGSALSTVQVFGDDFYSPYFVQWRPAGSSTWQRRQTTYVSPGEVTFTVTSAMKTVGRHSVRVKTPTSLGSASNSVQFQVTAAAPVWSPHYLQFDTYPTSMLRNTPEQFIVSLRHSPSGNIATTANGRVTITADPYGSFAGTMSIQDSPVNGIVIVNGSVTLAGLYNFTAVHSPVSGTAASPATTTVLTTVHNPDPVLSRPSPPWFSPEAVTNKEFNIYGSNFVNNDSIIEYAFNSPNDLAFSGWSSRDTSFDTANRMTGTLRQGDLAFNSNERYRYLRVNTNFAISGEPTDYLRLLVSPSTGTQTTVFSPFYLGPVYPVGQLTFGAQFVNEPIDVLTQVFHTLVPPVAATYATGIVRITTSPESGLYSGSGSDFATPVVGSQLAFLSPAISSYGSYRLKATYSPGAGEPSVTSSQSALVSVYLRPSAISRVSPVEISPADTQTIHIYGSGFSVTDKVYVENSSLSIDGPRSPSFLSSSHLSFAVSPGDYDTVVRIATVTVGTPTWSYAESNSATFNLYPTSSVQYVIDLVPDENNPPAILTQPQITGNQLSTVQMYVYDTSGNVINTAGGYMTLTLTNSLNVASVSSRQAVSSGYVSFSGLTAPATGVYALGALYSPTTGSATEAEDETLYVLNKIGIISSTSPTTFEATNQPKTIRVFGSNFINGVTSLLVNGSENFSWIQSVPSPREMVAVLTSSISNSVATHQLGIKTVYAAAGGAPYYGQQTVPLIVTQNSNTPVYASEETLPATIVVSPRGYARVRNKTGAITPGWVNVPAPATNYGSDSLWYAIRNLAGSFNTASVPGTIQPTQTSPGAADVVEVTAGMYSHFSFMKVLSNNNANHPVGVAAYGLKKNQALIIRARKTSGIAEPVVIRTTSFMDLAGSTYPCLTFRSYVDSFPDFLHFYDLKFMGSHYGVESWKATDLDGTKQDHYYQDHVFQRCAVLGTYDHRTISLTPYRTTQSTQSNDLVDQTQWNHQGQELVSATVSPRNSFLWRMDFDATEIHRALQSKRYCVSVPAISPNDINPISTSVAVVLGTSPTNGMTYLSGQSANRLINLSTSSTADTTSPYYLRLTLQTDGTDGGGASSRSNVSIWDGSWNLLSLYSGVIPVGSVYNNNWPLTGRVIGGVAVYPNIIFRQPGYYHFTAQLIGSTGANILPTTVTKDVYVQVTTPGASQKEITLTNNFGTASGAYTKATLPKLRLDANKLSTIFALPVGTYCSSNPLEQPTVNAPMVNGTLLYSIDQASYTSGWRWARYSGILVPTQPRQITGHMINGFGNVYTSPSPSYSTYGQQGVRLKYTGSDSTYASHTVTITASVNAIAPAESIVSGAPTYSIQFISSTQNTFAYTPVKNSSWWSIDGGYFGATNMGQGRVFCAGWPGSPEHPNYDPETTGIYYPRPSDCPYLTYPEGRSMKQGNQLYMAADYLWDGGFVGHIFEEHGFYFHNNRNVTVRNSLIKYTGRTGIQSLNWWQDNKPNQSEGTQTAPNNKDNVSQYGNTFRLENNVIKDCGITQNARAITIADYAGDIVLTNNAVLLGFNDKLRHWESTNSGALIVYDGSMFVTALGISNTLYWNLYMDYMLDQNGRIAVDWEHIAQSGTITRPTTSGALWTHLSPLHPYYYIKKLFQNYPLLTYASGTGFQPTSPRALNNFSPKHPYFNRAYGHPRFSKSPHTRSITVTKPPPLGPSAGSSVSVTLGSPTVGFYGGLQKVGSLSMVNNRIWGNSWFAGAKPLSTALSGDPFFNEYVCADWVTPGATPEGMMYQSSTYANSGARTQGTGFVHPFVTLGGIRKVTLTKNSIKPGNNAVGKIEINQKQSSGNSLAYPPILTVTGHANKFATSGSNNASFRYFHTDVGNPYVSALYSQLLSSVSPSPNLYF